MKPWKHHPLDANMFLQATDEYTMVYSAKNCTQEAENMTLKKQQ